MNKTMKTCIFGYFNMTELALQIYEKVKYYILQK